MVGRERGDNLQWTSHLDRVLSTKRAGSYGPQGVTSFSSSLWLLHAYPVVWEMKPRRRLVTCVSLKASPGTHKTNQSKLVARGKKEIRQKIFDNQLIYLILSRLQRRKNMNLFFYHKFLLRWNVSERKYKSPVEVSFPVHRSIESIKRNIKLRHDQNGNFVSCFTFK